MNEDDELREAAAQKRTPVEFLKDMRVDIDRSLKNAQTFADMLNRGPGGRHVALCITHLEDAKMRLGLALGELGHGVPEKYRDEYKKKEIP